jgi:hypothetical protein
LLSAVAVAVAMEPTTFIAAGEAAAVVCLQTLAVRFLK